MSQSVAFALGGLGGMNAHGVGFLAAAQEVARVQRTAAYGQDGLYPGLEFISCTSGMIHWTAEYLNGTDLAAEIAKKVESTKRAATLPRSAFWDPWRAPLIATFRGLPGVFDPLWKAYGQHLARRLGGFWDPVSPHWLAWPTTWGELWDWLLPARWLIPAFPDTFYAGISDTFNRSRVGVAFNSYHPRQGLEYLHVNAAALERIRRSADPDANLDRVKGRTVYKPVTPEYVKAGLWLLEYGFEELMEGESLVDGAYYRSVILDQLTFADTIFVPRPLATKWIGRLPHNVLEREDFKIELWFNASYLQQRKGIALINDHLGRGRRGYRLVRDEHGSGDGGEAEHADTGPAYHHIALEEIEIQVQRGYFDYFIEDQDVFDRSYAESLERLLTRPPAAHRPAVSRSA